MKLKDIKEYFKTAFHWSDSISIGKIDNNSEKAVCFYNSKFMPPKISSVGGKRNKDYELKAITILLRWGKNADTAEEMAKKIYDFFDERTFDIDGKRVFVISRYEVPIDLGTDEKGVYEYSFEFDFYSQKE
ncbi:MAG: minor capsid protein [Clostridia bacterium]|nr:minor capsid protein [Clostridia bacterium]